MTIAVFSQSVVKYGAVTHPPPQVSVVPAETILGS